MEFHEKLQGLRKGRGLTQEELAEALYVSRTAISKWESGKGIPSIDSLREISRFFSVSIDNLLSSEELLDAARRENEENQRRLLDLLFGVADLGAAALILLPLYPEPVGRFHRVGRSLGRDGDAVVAPPRPLVPRRRADRDRGDQGDPQPEADREGARCPDAGLADPQHRGGFVSDPRAGTVRGRRRLSPVDRKGRSGLERREE
jgi:transcriptional regulator with XRE-family HTH domain